MAMMLRGVLRHLGYTVAKNVLFYMYNNFTSIETYIFK